MCNTWWSRNEGAGGGDRCCSSNCWCLCLSGTMQDEKRCEAYTNRSLEVSQAEVISVWTVPLNRLRCCRSSPGPNRPNLLPLLPGVTHTPNTWKAVASGRAFSARFACEQILWFEADCDARARLCEASARAWECCSDLQPAPSRLGMKMCHIPFHAPFQIPLLPQFHSPPLRWAVLLFFWCQDVDMLSKKESCLVIAICCISVDSPSTGGGWRLIKQAHISLGTLLKKK